VLLHNGSRLVSQHGSHAKFRRGGAVGIVPMGRKDLKLGTTRSIILQSGLGEEAFETGRHRDAA